MLKLIAEDNSFARPPNQQDGSDTIPAAKATPLSPNPLPTSLPLSSNGSSGSVEPVKPIEEILCCLNKNKRMSICSEEVCQLSEEEKKKLKGACLLMLREESGRPESPVPFPKSGSDSTVTTPQQEEMKSFGLAVSNTNIEQKKECNTSTNILVAEELQSRGMEGLSTSQKVEKSEENGVQRTRTIKIEESFSHSSSSFSSVRASQSTRCITPEICEIMEKPFGSPSLLPSSMDRPTTPQQVISFPPEIPEFFPRTGTPQPQPLQRILTEELGVKPLHPSLPKQEVAELFQVTSSKDDSKMVRIEELYTKSQVGEIVKKELIRYKAGTEFDNSSMVQENEKQQIQIQQQQELQQQLQRQEDQQRQEQLQCQQEHQRQEQLQHQQEQQRKEKELERQEQVKFQQEQAQQEKQRKEQLKHEHDQMKLQHQQQTITQQFHQGEYQQKHISHESESQTNNRVQSLPYEKSISSVHMQTKIIRPKPQMVPLPPETTPYQPPPAPPKMSEEEQHAEMLEYRNMACQSPLVAALTVAPSRHFSPTTFQPITTLDDLPTPPAGGSISLLSALTIAPEEPFHPFPKPVDVSRVSPPKFQKWPQQSAVSQESSQKSMIQRQEQTTSCIQQSQTDQKSMSGSEQICDKQQVSKCTENNSAFKPMFKPHPLPLHEPIIKQSTQPASVTKSFPSVTDELKSNSVKPYMQSFPPKSEVDAQSISPSGLHKPGILPHYQQNMGDNSLPNRSKSPIAHKAPMIDSSKSQYSQRSSSVAGNIISSNNARARNFIGSSIGYVSSSVYGQTFTSGKDEPSQRPKSTTFGEASDNLLPYYQQNIGEIPLAHRPKSPVPHPIKAPSECTPARASPIMNKPSPLAGKAPETLSKSKQVFKPEVKSYNNVFATPPEPLKLLNKTLPHFTKPKTVEETSQKTPGVPWVMKKVEELSSSSVTKNKREEKTSLSSLLRSTMPLPVPSQSSPTAPGSQKSAAGFTPPKPVGAPTTSVPPTGAGGGGSGGNKGATFAGSTAPRRGRGTLNPSVAPGARIPLCGSCNSQIRGPFITALGKIWCPEHFVCANGQCRRPLQDVGFVEESSGLYCEFCFEQFLAPSCNKCSKKIKGDCLNAIGKHFHPECFCCSYCGKLFGNSPFFLEDALPYCENDWNELFTTKCFSCGFPIEAGDRWVEALANNYHSQCFNCTMCKKNLEGQSFFAKGGRPFCKNHAR